MAYVLISKLHKKTSNVKWLSESFSNAYVHGSTTAAELHTWLQDKLAKQSNVVVSQSNIVVSHSNVATGNATVSVSHLTFSTINKFAATQPGFKKHVHTVSGDTADDLYVFDTSTNGVAFQQALKNDALYQSVLAYYASNNITQSWEIIP